MRDTAGWCGGGECTSGRFLGGRVYGLVMDEELRERVERAAETAALFNAVKHESDADVGAVMGPLMGENPEFREHSDAIPGVVGGVVSRVNEMSHE